MRELPTYVYPFVLALVAFVAGRLVLARARDDAGSLPGWVLYALTIACVVAGLVSVWLDTRY